jgi:hypothetical protein
LALPVGARELSAHRQGLIRVVDGLRQTLVEGSADAATRMVQWTDKLVLDGVGAVLRSSTGLAADLPSPRRSPASEPVAVAAASRSLPSRGADAALRALGGLSFGGGSGRVVALTLGHASPSFGAATAGQPSSGFVAMNGGEGLGRSGRGVAEQALAGHELNVGIPVPALPWAQLAGGRFWWGTAGLMPEVRGTRVGLKLAPLPLVEVEGGRMQDNVRGPGAYVSARLRIPLN